MSQYEFVESLARMVTETNLQTTRSEADMLARSFLECNHQRKELAKKLGAIIGGYTLTIKGKVNISVALTRSSLPANPSDDQINAKRLSDWTPIVLDFKNPHPKC